jgi:hypothetical protein
MIGYREIQIALQSIWPDLNQIWCFDKEYVAVTSHEVTTFLNDGGWFPISEIEATNPDCDDFAVQQFAKVKRHFNWPFGEVFASKIHGWSVLHSLNICICQDGVILIDPKPHMIWQPDITKDNVIWARF